MYMYLDLKAKYSLKYVYEHFPWIPRKYYHDEDPVL